LRFEVRRDSALPAKLIELGYAVRHCGTTIRLTPTGTVETITAKTGKQTIRRTDVSRRSI
jgi:membrane protein involved in colicin uptake